MTEQQECDRCGSAGQVRRFAALVIPTPSTCDHECLNLCGLCRVVARARILDAIRGAFKPLKPIDPVQGDVAAAATILGGAEDD